MGLNILYTIVTQCIIYIVNAVQILMIYKIYMYLTMILYSCIYFTFLQFCTLGLDTRYIHVEHHIKYENSNYVHTLKWVFKQLILLTKSSLN